MGNRVTAASASHQGPSLLRIHTSALTGLCPPTPPPRRPLPLQGRLKPHGASLKSSPRLGPPLTQSGDRGLPPPPPSQPPESPQPPNGLFPPSTFSLETETSALQGAPEDWGRPLVPGAGPPLKHNCSRSEGPPTSQVRHCPRRTRTGKQPLAVLFQGFSRLRVRHSSCQSSSITTGLRSEQGTFVPPPLPSAPFKEFTLTYLTCSMRLRLPPRLKTRCPWKISDTSLQPRKLGVKMRAFTCL